MFNLPTLSVDLSSNATVAAANTAPTYNTKASNFESDVTMHSYRVRISDNLIDSYTHVTTARRNESFDPVKLNESRILKRATELSL